MLRYSIGFLIIALIAAVLAFGGIVLISLEVARFIFFVFFVLFVIFLVLALLKHELHWLKRK